MADNLTETQKIQNALTQKRQEIGQRFADLPKTETNLRANLFGGDPALETLRSQESDKVKELFEHDKAVAAQYQTPPEPGMVLDPYIRELQLTNRYRGTMEDLTGVRKKISTRQDIVGDMVDKAMKVFLAGLDALKYEATGLEGDLTRRRQQMSDVLDVLGKTGGAVPSDITTDLGLPAGLSFPSGGTGGTAGERDRIRALAALRQDVQRGVPFYELMPRYGKGPGKDGLEEFEIRNEYNAGPLPKKLNPKTKKPYGSAKETSAQIQGGGGYKTPAKRSTEFQAEVNEAQALVNELRRNFTPENQVQQAINDILKRSPDLKGYIK